jgi:hypothetical protein
MLSCARLWATASLVWKTIAMQEQRTMIAEAIENAVAERKESVTRWRVSGLEASIPSGKVRPAGVGACS